PAETAEDVDNSTVEKTTEEPVAMGGSFGFGGNEAMNEEYKPVEKEPIVLENVPLDGSFGFESEDTKVETLTNAVVEEETPAETAEDVDNSTVEKTTEDDDTTLDFPITPDN
ncbi:MAG: hypothetical protein UD936_05230, partial [Acutalibacteraceae bacterium]|nr:hypothetical protein [Acutalibacteraceae bacterium]